MARPRGAPARSVGIAYCLPGRQFFLDEFLARADGAMYAHKLRKYGLAHAAAKRRKDGDLRQSTQPESESTYQPALIFPDQEKSAWEHCDEESGALMRGGA